MTGGFPQHQEQLRGPSMKAKWDISTTTKRSLTLHRLRLQTQPCGPMGERVISEKSDSSVCGDLATYASWNFGLEASEENQRANVSLWQ
jgi:hypothetical protein